MAEEEAALGEHKRLFLQQVGEELAEQASTDDDAQLLWSGLLFASLPDGSARVRRRSLMNAGIHELANICDAAGTRFVSTWSEYNYSEVARWSGLVIGGSSWLTSPAWVLGDGAQGARQPV